jgi:hypothetical protein
MKDFSSLPDVAIGPGVEGRGLLVYLRKAKVPFLAFRGKIADASTEGSPRLIAVKQRRNLPLFQLTLSRSSFH